MTRDLGAVLREHVLAERERLLDDRLNRHGHRDLARRPRIGHEIARETQDPTRRLADASQPLEAVGVAASGNRGLLSNEPVGVRDDGGERVVQLVDDPGGDLPEARELLGLHHVRVQRAEVARVGGRLGVSASEPETTAHRERRAPHDVHHRRVVVFELRVVAREMEGRARLDVEDPLVREAGEEPRGIHADAAELLALRHVLEELLLDGHRRQADVGRRRRRLGRGRNETRADAALREDLPERAHMNWTIAVSPSATGISHAATTRRSSHAASTSTAPVIDTSDSRLIGTDDTVTRSDVSLTGMLVVVRTMPLAS